MQARPRSNFDSLPPSIATGEMQSRLQDIDWSKTSLGPIERWPQALKTAVGICLRSPLPMFVWWGSDLINIYNDAYAPILGKRHPDALGKPAREVWSDIWPQIASMKPGLSSG